ncbi:MAG: hypothetical protein F4081_07645, partial [Dehalococcoidia bacterium]|nr:hypothetical protein [Dehalococcoidia bacterium]
MTSSPTSPSPPAPASSPASRSRPRSRREAQRSPALPPSGTLPPVASLEIPLFPLRAVLFPGHELPLQIFEERYKTMTRELLESGGVFGVILIKHGNEVGGSAVPYDVGTTAVIEEHRELPGGRFQLGTRGRD